MPKLPELRSKEQIAGEILDSVRARVRKDIDITDNSVLMQFIEAIAQNLFKSSADIITMIDSNSVDRATGESLQRLALDRNVPILSAMPATGRVTITDTTFTKISTSIYPGQPAPVAGSVKIYVADASKFSSTGGQIYIGRQTNNVEGPLTYTAVTPEAGGAYWSITLAGTSPTTRYHNIGESIVFAQGGNRYIQANTTLQTAQGASVSAVGFITTSAATILDGETSISNVPVKCSSPGTLGNIARGALKEVLGLSFNAVSYNDSAFSNGSDADYDDVIRDRIKKYEQAKAKGIEVAIQYASIGVTAKDELKKVKSSSIVRYPDNSSELVFDDGSGYEPNFVGSPFETVVDQAVGGEKELQLRQKPIAQARLKSAAISPFYVNDLSFLAVEIDGVETQHQFKATDFKVLSSGTAAEIAASINGNYNLNFLCSTFGGGANVVIYPKDRFSNNIKIKTPISGENANDILQFPLNETTTLRLYKNDLPLYQDGYEAEVSSLSKSLWQPSITAGDTLTYQVDGTPAVTTTFTLEAFQAIDISQTVSSSTSIDVWAQVCNNLMPGVLTSVVGDVLVFKSARGFSNSASIAITGGTIIGKLFSTSATLSKTGKSSDYTLNKQTGQLSLTTTLVAGDKVTVGSQYTRGNLITSQLYTGPAAAGKLWLIADGSVESIVNGLKTDTLITFSKTGTKLTIDGQSPSAVPEGFELAKKGDWLVVWANDTDPSALINNQGFWRIESTATGSITVDDGTTVRTPGFTTVSSDRILIVRSDAPVQELNFTAGSLSNFLTEVSNQLVGVQTDVIGTRVRLSTKTLANDGELYLVAADANGGALGLTKDLAMANSQSHFGFVATTDGEVNVPSFTYGTLGSALSDSTFAFPDPNVVKSFDGDFIEILNKNGNISSPSDIIDSNKSRRSFMTNYVGGLASFKVPQYMRSGESLMQQDDRFFLRKPYMFDSKDTVGVIVDSDLSTKTYALPVSRLLTVSNHSTPSTADFSASDAESSLAMNDPASFYDFDFSNFKVHRQARTVLTNGTYSISIKNIDYGPQGNKVRVGFVYPDGSSQTELSHSFDTSELSDIKITLPVGDIRTPNWDYTTSFSVSKTTTGGKDSITFTYRSGTQPDFSVTGSSVLLGDIVTISANSDFLSVNKGITGRISNVTATSFTVQMPTGAYENDDTPLLGFLNTGATTLCTTSASHNLTTGQRIGIWNTDASYGSTYPFNETSIVTVLSSNTFTINTPTAVPSSPIQYGTHIAGTVTLNTSTPHGFTAGNLILVTGAGGSYDGLFTISGIPTPTQIEYSVAGASSPISSGNIYFQSATASMARSLGGNAGNNLQFFSVTTTAQEVVDYISSNLSDKLVATSIGNSSAVISISTQDLGLASNYINISVDGMNFYANSRKAYLKSTSEILAGSFIKLSGTIGEPNDVAILASTYVVLDSFYDVSTGRYFAEICLPIVSVATSSHAVTVTATGSLPLRTMVDGENSVLISNLSSGPAIPMFAMKKSWSYAPEIGENLKLVAVTNDHLNRFWNKLIVTGFSNTGNIAQSRYGRDMQLSTKTFGGNGSVQITGGTANSTDLAVQSGATELNYKLGLLKVPYETRQGLLPNQWINVYNTVRQNKVLNFDNTTTIKLYTNGVEITAGSGIFQTPKTVAATDLTLLKTEKHGDFLAIIPVDGLFNITAGGITEGDWVRFKNIQATDWSVSTFYPIGSYVNYLGIRYYAILANNGQQPDINPNSWERREFNQANQGIFQVVRTFGNSFWIKHSNAVEETFFLGNANNIQFYSYDSVMPGDTVVITTDNFGTQNIGRYTVLDDSTTTSFPTATRLYTTAIPTAVSSLTLGGDYSQFNVEEKDPTSLWKNIMALGPANSQLYNIIVDSPNLITKISNSLGAGISVKGKLGFTTSAAYGIDGYQSYKGLIQELNRIIYGDPTDTTNYPGVRAAGTSIGIKEAILRRITADFVVRVKSGVPFGEIRDRCKAAVAGYVNSLDVGESVSISSMIAACGSIPGVVSVAVTYPIYDSSNDLITVAPNERAFVLDTSDISISALN
jgi:uncharacterized phage protein gp47/JayE